MVEKEGYEPRAEKPAEASWNLASSFMDEIRESLFSASKGIIQQDFKRVFNSLKAVRLRIVQYLSSEERELFRQKERIIENYINLRSRLDVYDETQERKWGEYTLRIQRYVELYNDMIMDALKKYSLSIPDKEEAMF